MTEAQFNQIVDDLMFSIEESIDDSGADIDYEIRGMEKPSDHAPVWTEFNF